MTQYITTDFSDHPADWTSRYDTLGTWSVTGGDLGLSAGKSNDWRVLSWNDIDADANRDNVEVLALVRFVSFSGTNYFLTVRGSGADESATLYSVAATSSTLRLYYCSGSDFPNLINSSSFTISGSTDYWVRFRVDATSLKARIWADGESEPGAWLLDEVDSSVTGVGWVGAAAYGTQTPATWKQIGVGTNGDTAPSSAGGGGATLTVQDLTQGHSLGSPSLTEHNVLAVQGVGQAHTLGAPTLTQHQVLSVDAIAQAHALGNVTLTQAHVLVVQGATQGQTLGAPSLTQHNALTPDALTQAQTLGNISLTVAGSIAAADIAQGHSIGSPSLTQHNVLTVAALMQAHSLGNVDLTQAGTLTVHGMTQGQVLEAVALVQHHALAVQEILQAHALGNVTLTASDALAVAGITQAQLLEAPALTQHNVLVVQGMTQAQILQACTLGGLVIGSLAGTIVAYALLDGALVAYTALDGTVETVH